MKILMLTSTYKDPSLGSRDPGTNIVNSFVKEWTKQGHEVLVVHNSHCYTKLVHKLPQGIKHKMEKKFGTIIADYKAVAAKHYSDNGAEVYRLPIRKLLPHKTPAESVLKKQLQKIVKILEQEQFHPDVITSHWASPQMELVSELKRKFGCKTAVVLHGYSYVTDPKFPKERYLPYVDHLGVRSDYQAKRIRERLKLEQTPFVCYSGVPDQYLENYELNTDKFRDVKTWKLAFVGRLVAYKKVDVTIRALAECKDFDWELTVVGDGAERERLEALCRELHCEDKVHFTGLIPRDRVMQILRDTHVFVMVSYNEIFGLVYLEAMAASCLTVATVQGGIDGVIVNGENGFLCVGRTEPLQKVLGEITALSEEERIRIAAAGYKTAHDFSDAKVAARYLEEITK